MGGENHGEGGDWSLGPCSQLLEWRDQGEDKGSQEFRGQGVRKVIYLDISHVLVAKW